MQKHTQSLLPVGFRQSHHGRAEDGSHLLKTLWSKELPCCQILQTDGLVHFIHGLVDLRLKGSDRFSILFCSSQQPEAKPSTLTRIFQVSVRREPYIGMPVLSQWKPRNKATMLGPHEIWMNARAHMSASLCFCMSAHTNEHV